MTKLNKSQNIALIYLFDSYYTEGFVTTACIGITEWRSEDIEFEKMNFSEITSKYVSGQFYKRELPGILELLDDVKLKSDDYIVLDGYVYLDDIGTRGLGGYLFEELENSIPIIGVAKNRYKSIGDKCIELLRGESKKPLYVTSAGIEIEKSSEYILLMSGEFRIPKMFKLVDTISREKAK
ncbi:endonuclease V [Lewinellaceae bacterium SD302]|nr:endonuclease V [Lewinellaceae bacterium SD302]